MIQASDTQVISYAYGFSNYEFTQIANSIKEDGQKIESLKYEALVFEETSKALSNWNDEVVFFTPLIIPIRSMGGL